MHPLFHIQINIDKPQRERDFGGSFLKTKVLLVWYFWFLTPPTKLPADTNRATTTITCEGTHHKDKVNPFNHKTIFGRIFFLFFFFFFRNFMDNLVFMLER